MMLPQESALTHDWPRFLTAGLLVMVRLSGLFVFAPIFSSSAVAPRIKAGFVFAMTILLAPAVTAVSGARPVLDMNALLGELGVGLMFGFSLTMLTESIVFAGALLGMQFSFSLVNLLDPNSHVETPVLGQMLGWMAILIMLGAGLDRTLIAAVVRSFMAVPVGRGVIDATTSVALVRMAGGIFLAGLQLASPVIAATMAVEVTVALIGKLSPQLPTQILGIPLKTMTAYAVLIACLGVWPGWVERHFVALLDSAGKMLVRA